MLVVTDGQALAGQTMCPLSAHVHHRAGSSHVLEGVCLPAPEPVLQPQTKSEVMCLSPKQSSLASPVPTHALRPGLPPEDDSAWTETPRGQGEDASLTGLDNEAVGASALLPGKKHTCQLISVLARALWIPALPSVELARKPVN